MNSYAPWIVEDVEEKISTALGANQLTCVRIHELVGKAVVPNEFLDLLTFYVADNGLEKLEMRRFRIESEQGGTLDIQNAHFDEEVLTRLANMCPRISTLTMTGMPDLS